MLHGRLTHISQPLDVEGFSSAAGAGLALGTGARAIVLTKGQQIGFIANLDLSGLTFTPK